MSTTAPLSAAGLLTRRVRALPGRRGALSARWVRRPATHAILSLLLAAAAALAQNVVDDNLAGHKAEPITLKAEDVKALVAETPDFAARADSPEARRVAAKLDAHVAEFIAGFPWKAFHNTLGISGYEAYFNHPDEMFYALSIALPSLKPETAAAARKFLAEQLAKNPPYAADGFDNAAGRPREAYDVPETLRVKGRGRAADAFGAYAFWAYGRWSGDTAAVRSHGPAIRERLAPLLAGPYSFDVNNTKYVNDEAERLNGNLAGLVGLARLARLGGDADTAAKAEARALELLTLRVNLERTNPNILEPTRSATKSLHVAKLARFCRLAPEVGRAADRLSDGAGRARVRAFREARNAWYLAFAERMIGGENYVSPPHMGRAMMAGATFMDDLGGEQLLGFVDVPWCKGDLYFIEKCTYALWAAAGRPWTKAEP